MALRLRVALGAVSALAACLLPAGPARAIHIILPTVSIRVGPADNPTSVSAGTLEERSASVVVNEDGSVSFLDGSMSKTNWLWEWSEIRLKEDPQVSFAQDFTNLNAGAMDFVFSTSLGVGSITPSTLIGGSTSVTIADGGDGGATLENSSGLPGYAGTIDGSTELTLLDPFSLQVIVAGGTNATTDTDGLSPSGPTLAGPAGSSTIGITHNFNLSGEDTATFNSTFVVQVIPEPATIILLGLGCAGLAAFASRMRS